MPEIDDWIDKVVAVAGSVDGHAGGKVRAYRMAERGEVPESLTTFPCAIVYPMGVQVQLSAGMSKEIWRVQGDFYLFPDCKKTNLPDVMRYFAKIRKATALNGTLSGTVEHFSFTSGEEAMQFVVLQYAEEVDRHAIRVVWEVKADVSAETVVSA